MTRTTPTIRASRGRGRGGRVYWPSEFDCLAQAYGSPQASVALERMWRQEQRLRRRLSEALAELAALQTARGAGAGPLPTAPAGASEPAGQRDPEKLGDVAEESAPEAES